GFTERIHTPGGVRSLVEGSHLMKLLRDLDKDGFNVDGPLAELNGVGLTGLSGTGVLSDPHSAHHNSGMTVLYA
ncbi:hypothetical protein ACSLO2_27595, partial [Escherichia coli]